MKFVPTLVMAILVSLCVYLYTQVVELHSLVKTPAEVTIIREGRALLDQDIALKLIRATVKVGQLGSSGNGSGVVIYSHQISPFRYENFILTAAHCVAKPVNSPFPDREVADQMVIERFEYESNRYVSITTTMLAEIVACDFAEDVALLRVTDSIPYPMVPAVVSDEDMESLKLYDPVFAIGCPMGLTPFITNGNISIFGNETGHLVFSAPVFFGNSGGPVVTADGKLIGIVSAMIRGPYGHPYPHAGLAVPCTKISKFLIGCGAGFIVDAKDPSSFIKLDIQMKEKAKQAQIEKEARELAEKAKKLADEEYKKKLKLVLEDFMHKMSEEGALQPK